MTWVGDNKADIIFVISLIAGMSLIVVGLVKGDSPSVLLGAGALGIPGFSAASGSEQ